MTADALIMEALARIEHKVDLALELAGYAAGISKSSDLPKMGDPNHTCVLCTQPIKYDVNIQDGVVVRKCGCSTGKIALDMGAFAPPVLPARKKPDDGRDAEEDRSDPNRRPRNAGKR